MPTVRRSESTRTAANVQPTLGFSAKKSIHKSPAKKKTQNVLEISKPPQPIDLTLSSPPRAAKTYAPLFTRPKRTDSSEVNPFEDEEDTKPDVTGEQAVQRDEFGFVSTVPVDFAPLGKGKPTKAMIANLVGEGTGADETEGSESDGEPKDEAVKSKPKEKLNVKDKRWNKIYKETQEKMGGEDVEPIHCTPKSHNRIDHILRVFDLSSEWGPCVGISRLDRWKRAEGWGLEPPTEIRDILLSEGAEDKYGETIFHDRGIYVP